MKGIFCESNTKSNEEFRKVIKVRMGLQAVLAIVGLITIAVIFYLSKTNPSSLSEYLQGLYAGVGTGLFAAGTILFIKNAIALRNEEKLRKLRISNTDERLIGINHASTRVATCVLLIAMYIVALVGGVFDELLVKTMFILICLFLVSYVIAYKILEAKR